MNRPNHRFAWLCLAVTIAIAAFFLRLPQLSERPMHTDEAVHAAKLGLLLETGQYEYNPHEYHGPVIYYAALPFAWLSGAGSMADLASEAPLRLPIVVFGALVVLAVGLCGPSLGRAAMLFAALVIALSPAFVFYSKYFIQEVPFVLFCFWAMVCGLRLLETARWKWAIGMGLSTGFSIGLKETWVLVLGTGLLTAMLLQMTSTRHRWPLAFPWRRFYGLLLSGSVIAVVTGVALLSNFFRHPPAIVHAFSAMLGYVLRGVTGDSSTFGAGIHDHPWYYYMQLLAWPQVEGPWLWTEGFTLVLGVIGFCSVIRRWVAMPAGWHFVAIYTVLITAFYSAIPYKTPWNVLPMLLAWSLLAGRGCAALMSLGGNCRWGQWSIGLILLAWPALLGVQTYRATIQRPADVRNPYAYSPTSTNVRELAKRADALAAVTDSGHRMLIQVVSPDNDYWPLPWYLRRFPNIGYYTDFNSLDRRATMIISTGDVPENLPTPIGERQTEYYGLRPDVVLTTLIAQESWDAFMETRK